MSPACHKYFIDDERSSCSGQPTQACWYCLWYYCCRWNCHCFIAKMEMVVLL